MYEMRCHNPTLYRSLNSLWKKEIGSDETFQFKFVMMYLVRQLEDYLNNCESHYKILS